MKKILIGMAIGAVIATGVSVPLTWYIVRCDDTGGSVEQGTPGPLSQTTITDNTPAGLYCGDKIDITGTMQDDTLFVGCRDNCKGNSRTFPMRAKCPARYRPYSIMLQPLVMAGYNRDRREFGAMAGLNAAFLWNFPRGSVGVGALYARSLTASEWYAGASVVGIFDFGKLKTVGE